MERECASNSKRPLVSADSDPWMNLVALEKARAETSPKTSQARRDDRSGLLSSSRKRRVSSRQAVTLA